MDIAVQSKKLGKHYSIAKAHPSGFRYQTLQESLIKLPGRTLQLFRRRQSREIFWAIRDIDLEIRQGEVLGIIGRNGAGKSTLLKVLSRITTPSEGHAEIHGRVGSLLEVGTGFHPELTGRENVFLSGAVLGLRRHEIRQKFDEIVAFAEIEKFVDTPAKFYSSGMYTRLGFAVAAHLEPEILIVDEVLAVGDFQFQKKCLSKMKEVGREGRTVIFVSHNMPAVSTLCSRVIMLSHGRIFSQGTPEEIIIQATRSHPGQSPDSSVPTLSQMARVDCLAEGLDIGDSTAKLLSVEMCKAQGTHSAAFMISEPVSIRMCYEVSESGSARKLVPNLHFYREDGSCAFITSPQKIDNPAPGRHRWTCRIPANFLNDGVYSVGVALSSFEDSAQVHFYEQAMLTFVISDPIEGVPTRQGFTGMIPGAVRPLFNWEYKNI